MARKKVVAASNSEPEDPIAASSDAQEPVPPSVNFSFPFGQTFTPEDRAYYTETHPVREREYLILTCVGNL